MMLRSHPHLFPAKFCFRTHSIFAPYFLQQQISFSAIVSHFWKPFSKTHFLSSPQFNDVIRIKSYSNTRLSRQVKISLLPRFLHILWGLLISQGRRQGDKSPWLNTKVLDMESPEDRACHVNLRQVLVRWGITQTTRIRGVYVCDVMIQKESREVNVINDTS